MTDQAFWAYMAGLVVVYLTGFLSGRSGAQVVVIQAVDAYEAEDDEEEPIN